MTTTGGRVPADGDALATRFAVIVGAILVVAGVAGFVPDPLIGDPADGPFIVTGPVLDTIHLAAGMVALWIGIALDGPAQGKALVAFGGAWIAFTVLTVLSPSLFGILGAAPWYGVNLPGHLLHLALALAAVAIGILAGRDADDPLDAEPDPGELRA